MRDEINIFYNSFESIEKFSEDEFIELFMYFLTEVLKKDEATTLSLGKCFSCCDLHVPNSLAVKLSRGVKAKKFIKNPKGYRLSRAIRDRIYSRLNVNKNVIIPNDELRNLEDSICNDIRKRYLKESLNCFDIEAYRASIIMCWILTIDHLYDYIFTHRLNEFNSVLAANKDKNIKINKINIKDDFSEIPEGKFIEFAKSSKIISPDVKRILEQKLGTRNTAAHPSGVVILKNKAIDFIGDLITNVVLKYKI